MKEFAGGTFGLPCALVLRYLAEGEEHDKLQAQRDPARARRRFVSDDRSARAHRGALRDPVGERRRGRARRRRRGAAAQGRARARRSSASAPTSWRAPSTGCERRIVLGGHLDTVPPNDNAHAAPRRRHAARPRHRRHEGRPRGHARSSRRASRRDRPSHDVTFVFYEGEEVADEHNGLRRLFAERPDLVAGRPRGPARADRRVGRGRLPGHDPRARDVRRRARALGAAVDGHERDPPRRAAARTRRARSRPRRSTSTGSSTARRCRSCASRAGSRTTSCPTAARSSSTGGTRRAGRSTRRSRRCARSVRDADARRGAERVARRAAEPRGTRSSPS